MSTAEEMDRLRSERDILERMRTAEATVFEQHCQIEHLDGQIQTLLRENERLRDEVDYWKHKSHS